MPNIFIIHGTYGSPAENWFPWLKRKLKGLDKNNKVFVPKFPTPENQNLENWLKVFQNYEKQINNKTIFIAHSLGPAFVLNVLENTNTKVKACFFVSGFIGRLNMEKFDKINKTFTQKQFNWNKINNNCRNFYVIHSDNDPYVPMEKAKELANNLNTKPIIIKKAGHFNEDFGYTEFPLLLKKVKEELS